MEKKRRNILLAAGLTAALLLLLALTESAAKAGRARAAEVMASPAPTAVPSPTPSPTPVPTATPYVPQPPELSLVGDDPLVLTAAPEPYEDPGCRAWDSLDGDLTERLERTVDVDPYRAGEGSVRYTVTDSEGLSATAVRQVIVKAAELPETVEPEERTIYLSFDDGPSANTARLLEILDRYGVKATWFVTHTHPEYTDMIAEIAARGHSVGMHSATHDYQRIYAGEEAYFADLREIQDLIWEQTGVRPTILRFPGGSSNTVSWRNPGIMTRLTECLTDMGYQYFDWNVSTGDSGEGSTYDSVLRSVIEQCSQMSWGVVLQHDTNGQSVEAVAAIIEWGLSHGYSFRALDEHSPTAHHRIAN